MSGAGRIRQQIERAVAERLNQADRVVGRGGSSPALALVRSARELVTAKAKALPTAPRPRVVVSIFVNRLQFGLADDFDKYPRTFEADCEQLRLAGADVVFAPDEAALYPTPQTYFIDPSLDLTQPLEGTFRPDHFRGVCTVVMKLLAVTGAHIRLTMTEGGRTMPAPLDWSQCPAVESIPGKRSGAWVYKDSRMPVATVFDNLKSGASIEELIEWFDVTREQVEAVLEFVARSLDAPPVIPQPPALIASDAHSL